MKRLGIRGAGGSGAIEDFFGVQVLGGQDGFDEFANGAVAARMRGDEASLGENTGGGVSGSGGEAGEAHGGEIVYIVAHVTDLSEGETGGGGEIAQGGGLVATSLDDVRNVQLFSEAVDEGTFLAGDQGQRKAGAAGERDAHDIGKAKALPLITAGTPPEAAIGEDPVDIEREAADMRQSVD